MPETKLTPPTAGAAAGKILPPSIQHWLETMFGKSFADVRVHEDHRATLLGASAYTKGNDIHFAPGQYQPCTEEGKRLLSHELSHVVQQRSVGRPSVPGGMVEVQHNPASK